MRVPEAYLLVRDYETKRPGLLVLDADGRRVASIPLPGMGNPAITPAEIARRLTAARTADAVALWRVHAAGPGDAVAKFATAVAKLPGVAEAKRAGPIVSFRAPASVAPPAVFAAARGAGITATLREPVAVAIDADAANPAGVWHADGGRAYVASIALAAAPDVEARTFTFAELPQDGAACKVVWTVRDVPGVVAIRADVFGKRLIVLGRTGKVDWPAVRRAFADAGCPAAE